MAIQRMDNVLIVVDDIDAVIAFFVELGMELEGKGPVEGRWVERVIGIDDVRQDVAMLRTPDGHGRIELAMFHTPKAIRAEPQDAPTNTLGIRRIMFAVDDIDAFLAVLGDAGWSGWLVVEQDTLPTTAERFTRAAEDQRANRAFLTARGL